MGDGGVENVVVLAVVIVMIVGLMKVEVKLLERTTHPPSRESSHTREVLSTTL